MKLSISKSKNAESLYISKSMRINGKTTSKNVRKLGTMAELLPLHDNSRDKVIAWAKEEARRMTEDEKRDKDTVIIPLSQSKLINQDVQTLYNGGYLFLQSIFHSLKLDKLCDKISDEGQFHYSLGDILSRLIYSRIVFPSSKRSTYEDSKKFIEHGDFKLHDIYRALDVLNTNSEKIQEHIYEKSLNIIKRNTNVLYYDCTNYFFEIEEEKGSRKFGKNKEHRPLPIIQMGLFMDGDGYPLAFTIFPGNESEQTSMTPLEKKIIKDFQLSKFTVSTDAGLASTVNRKFNNMANRSFIVTQSLKKIKKHLKEWALSSNEWILRGNEGKKVSIEEIIAQCDNESYDYSDIDNQIWYKERWINENGLEQRMIVTFSPKYRKYQRKIRNRQIERALKKAESNDDSSHRNPNSPTRFLKTTNYTENGEVAREKEVTVDDEVIKNEEQYDGFYAVCTTLNDPVEEIIRINSRRWEIEESFRIIKSEFKARPVYLQKDERITAHFLVCFIALFFIRVLEKKLNEAFTTGEIIKTLKNMNFQYYEGYGYIPTYTRTKLTDELHEAFGFRTDYQITNENNMKKIINRTKKYYIFQ